MNIKFLAYTVLSVLAVFGAALGALALSYLYAGPVATIAYAFLFLFGAFGVPVVIMLGSPSFPGFLRKAMGKLHFILGQAAFGVGYLVEYDDRYEVHPGTKDKVWIDDEWRELDGGQTNFKILGWRPFGLVRYKDEDTLQNMRADPHAEVGSSRADGGTKTRAGYTEKPPDGRVSGIDGEWLIDLKRVATSGVKKMGDIDVLEKAEEIVMRKESKGSRTEGREALIGSIVGLLLGVMTGYFLLGGV